MVAVAGLGCGGATGHEALSKAEYESSFNAVGERMGPLEAEAERAIRMARDADEVRAVFVQFADSAREAGEAYDQLQPPTDIVDEHQAFADFALRTADFYSQLATHIPDQKEPGTEAAIEGEISEFLLREENQSAMRSFATAIEEGGYALTLTPFM